MLLVERDLSTPDRIVGELLQPGGCAALRTLGLEQALDGIDATRVDGYKVFWGKDEVAIPYPVLQQQQQQQQRDDGDKPVASTSKVDDPDALSSPRARAQGRSFHHGLFVQNLRAQARKRKGITLVEATVNDVLRALGPDGAERVSGLSATPKKRTADSPNGHAASANGDATSEPKAEPEDEPEEPVELRAKLTIVADGCFSKFRRLFLPESVAPQTRSHFVGLVLEDADMPAPKHGHVILRKQQAGDDKGDAADGEASRLGPVLVYQLSTHETRMLVDIAGSKLPSVGSGALHAFLEREVPPVLPASLLPSFTRALERSKSREARDKGARLRSMPNSYLPPHPQGRFLRGAFLAGDALNMRHPLTGGGMTVALNDVVVLKRLLAHVDDFETDWALVAEQLEAWHWARKGVASCVNVLAMALYSLFGAQGESPRWCGAVGG